MKKFLMFVLMFVACFMAVACNGNNDDTEVTSIKLGASGPLSGEVAVYGTAVEKGIKLAVEEINAAGGVELNGKKVPFELLPMVNDDADPTKAATALNTLVAEDANVIVGAVTSGATEGLISEAIKVGIPVITPTGTADKLTVGEDGNQRADRENIFRACFYDSYQGQYMAQYAKEQGYTKAYVLFNNDDAYSVGLKDAFVKTAAEGNVKLDVQVQSYTKATNDYASYWNAIKNGGYTCVYVPDYYEKVYSVVKAAAEAGYEGVIYGGDGWDGVTTQLEETFDVAFLEQCFYTNHYFGGSENEAVQKFVTAYKAKYNNEEPASFAALAYDAVYMVKQAIEECDSLDYDKIIEALSEATFEGLVTSSEAFSFVDGSPAKDAVVLTFENGKEVEAKAEE